MEKGAAPSVSAPGLASEEDAAVLGMEATELTCPTMLMKWNSKAGL